MLHLCFKWFEVVLDNRPYYRGIDLVIAMHKMMTHIGDILPRNIRMGSYKGTTEII